MTSDERALQYLADSNPIPDPKKLGQRAFESIDLPAIRRRRLTETEERSLMSTPEPRRSRPRWAVALAAAVVVVAVGVGIDEDCVPGRQRRPHRLAHNAQATTAAQQPAQQFPERRFGDGIVVFHRHCRKDIVEKKKTGLT